jgi:hypothetical protein
MANMVKIKVNRKLLDEEFKLYQTLEVKVILIEELAG